MKKALKPVVEFLQQHAEKKVKEILPEIQKMAESARTAGENVIKNAQGDVLALLDAYDKKWKPLGGSKAVAFTPKKTNTGWNSYSKAGQNAWTERNNLYNAAHELRMESLLNGSIVFNTPNSKVSAEAKKAVAEKYGLKEGSDFRGGTEAVIKFSKVVDEIKTSVKDLGEGFATKEECVTYLKKENLLK